MTLGDEPEIENCMEFGYPSWRMEDRLTEPYVPSENIMKRIRGGSKDESKGIDSSSK